MVMKCQGCVFFELCARRPALRIVRIASSERGSLVNWRTARLVRISSGTVMFISLSLVVLMVKCEHLLLSALPTFVIALDGAQAKGLTFFVRKALFVCCIQMRTGGENSGYSLVDDGDGCVDLPFGYREWRSHAEAVEHAAGRAHNIHRQPPSQAFVPDGDPQHVGWFFCLSILDKLDADEQSLAPYIPDVHVAVLEFTQTGQQVLSPSSCLFDQPLLLNHVDDGQPDCCRKRVGDVRGHMHEAFIVAIFLDLGGGEGGSKWDAAAKRFGNREHIRHDGERLKAEHGAEPPKAGLGFVENQEHPALLAKLAQAREILRWGDNNAPS